MLEKSIEQLKRVPLFSSIGNTDFELIAEQLTQENFPAGSEILHEGDPGDAFYILKKGRVRVFATLEDTNEEIPLSFLEEGDHFGEMSLITGESRSASINAVTDVEVWKLSKDTFDALILNNPSVTLTLTHLLTQRLKGANVARKASEEYYQHKFSPGGKISDVGIIKILKYAEDNSLSGKVILENNDDCATFHYRKGQLEKIDYHDLSEDEALDSVLTWNSGHFHIEPSVFKIDGGTTTDEAHKQKAAETTDDQPILAYLKEKFSEIVAFAGPRITRRAVNHAFHSFSGYFNNLNDLKIEIEPVIRISLRQNLKWTDKHSLMIAILLRDVIDILERDVIGLSFWSPRSADDRINDFLEGLQYFAFYDEAMEVIGS